MMLHTASITFVQHLKPLCPALEDFSSAVSTASVVSQAKFCGSGRNWKLAGTLAEQKSNPIEFNILGYKILRGE